MYLKHLVSIALAVSTVTAFGGIRNDIAIVHGNLTGIFAASYLAPFASDNQPETPYELIDNHEDLIEKRGAIVSLRKRADDCQKYHKISGADNCYTLSLQYNVEMINILLWNPQVNAKCTNMYNGKSYCVLKENDYIFETTCVQTHLVTDSDTCTSVIKQYGIKHADFYTMNPTVNNATCSNLLTGGQVCVKHETKPVLASLAHKAAIKTTSTRRSTKSSRVTRKAKTTTKKTTATKVSSTKVPTTTKATTTKATTTKATTTKATTTKATTTKATKSTTTAKATATKVVKISAASKTDKRKLLQKGTALTYYWIAHPEDYKTGGKSVTVKTCDGKSLGTVSEEYADALVMEGTGIVDNKVINLGGCTCNDYKCFMEVDKSEDPYGLTSFGTALRPYITIAANDIQRNTKIFVPDLEGWEIPGSSKKHNGCMMVDDRSWSFDDNHIDFYVYREKNYRSINGEHKISSVDVYEGGDCNLLNYA